MEVKKALNENGLYRKGLKLENIQEILTKIIKVCKCSMCRQEKRYFQYHKTVDR
jgi:queuine/archaeosine tRNA-ribosyltransferase